MSKLNFKYWIDKDSKIITRFSITAANIHDSIEIDKLIDENDKELYADAGYIGTMKTAMNDALKIRSIGIKRAVFSVGFTNLVYNILRFKTLIKYRQSSFF